MAGLGVAALLFAVPPAFAFVEGAPTLACYEQARQGLDLDEVGALRLCRGALSEAPASCFLEARRRTFLPAPAALLLCQCAPSTTPVDCYLQAQRETFLADHQLLQLCSPVMNGYPVGCAVYYLPPYGPR